MQAPKPEVKILVNHGDKTGDFTPFLSDLTWTNEQKGQSDTLSITLEDYDGRWINSWYPIKGSTLEAYIGYQNQKLLYCGEFNIENIDLSGGASAPDTVSITAHSASNRRAIRTKNHTAFEGKTLKDIAGEIARKHGLKVIGDVPNASYKHIIQSGETDLGFLQRLATENNAVFTVKGDQLIFHEIEKLDSLSTVWVIKKTDISDYKFNIKEIEKGVSVAFYDPDKKEILKSEGDQENIEAADTTKRTAKADQSQLDAMKTAALRKAKGGEITASINLEGNTALLAGCNIELQGFGVLDKNLMQITKATHKIGQGYSTALELALCGARKK